MNEYIVVISREDPVDYSVWETPVGSNEPHTLETARAQAAAWDDFSWMTAEVYQKVV